MGGLCRVVERIGDRSVWYSRSYQNDFVPNNIAQIYYASICSYYPWVRSIFVYRILPVKGIYESADSTRSAVCTIGDEEP